MQPYGDSNLIRKSPARSNNLQAPLGGAGPYAAGGRTYGPFVIAPLRQAFAPGPKPVPALSDYLALIYRRKLPIVAFVVGCVLAAFLYSRNLPEMYEASLVMDAERQNQSVTMGVDANTNTPFDVDQFIGTQVHLLQSDPVLRPVATQYNLLDEEKQLRRVPPSQLARAKAAPIVLKNLRVLRQPNTYLVQVSYRSTKPELATEVVNAIAASYANHLDETKMSAWKNLGSYTKQRLGELKTNMEVSALELQKMEGALGMVDPEDKSNIVASRLQQVNLDYGHAMADRANKDAAYEAIRGNNPEAAQASPQAESLKKLIDRRNEALQKFSDIRAIYGDGHPEYRRAQAQLKEIEDQLALSRGSVVRRVEAEAQEAQLKEANLRKEYELAKANADRLATGSLPYRMLKQKADSSRALYDEFVRKLGEAEINTGVQKTGARVLEPARVPLSPVSPNVPLNCAIALIASSLLATIAVVALDASSNRMRRVEDVRAASGHDVIGTLPPVKHWRQRKGLPSVAGADRLLPSDERNALETAFYMEAVRMLRSSLMAQADRRGVQTILVTSPRGREGRSTVASQLGSACADLGLKTLLIDGDLRKPSLQSLSFSERPVLGLSHVLKGEIRWQAAVARLSSKPMLHVIPAGDPSPNGAELISTALPRLLEESGRQCDLIILDSPPLLESAQAIEMARAADAVLLVVRANHSDPPSLRAALGHLERVEANIIGVVLNDYNEPRA